MLTGTKLPVQQQGDCKLGETHVEICKVKLLLFSLGCRGGGKSLFEVTTAVGSRWERDGLCILAKLGTGVCNWVVIVGEYLLSKRKPLRRLRALTAVCCFCRAYKSLLFSWVCRTRWGCLAAQLQVDTLKIIGLEIARTVFWRLIGEALVGWVFVSGC